VVTPSVPIDPDNGQPLVDLPPIVPVEDLEAAYLSYAPNDAIVLAPSELCLLRPGEEAQTGSNSLAWVDDLADAMVDDQGNQIVFYQAVGDRSRVVPGHGWWQVGRPVFGLLPSNGRPSRPWDTTYRYEERVVEVRVDDPEPRFQLPGYALRRGATYGVQVMFRGASGFFAMDRVQAQAAGGLVLSDISAYFLPGNTAVVATFTIAKTSGSGFLHVLGVSPVAFDRYAKVQVT
jgi:hypothetical protein